MKKRILALLAIGVVLSIIVCGCSFSIGNEKKIANIERDEEGGLKFTPVEEETADNKKVEITEHDIADSYISNFKEEDFQTNVYTIADVYSQELKCKVTAMLEWKPIEEIDAESKIGEYSVKDIALAYSNNDVTIANDFVKHIAALAPLYENGALTSEGTVATFANIYYEISREEPTAMSMFTLDSKHIYFIEETNSHCIVISMEEGKEGIGVYDVEQDKGYSAYATWLLNSRMLVTDMYGSLDEFNALSSSEAGTEVTYGPTEDTEKEYDVQVENNTEQADGVIDEMITRVSDWKNHPYNTTVQTLLEKNGMEMSAATKTARMIGAAADSGETTAVSGSIADGIIEIVLDNEQVYHVDTISGALYYQWDLIWSK